MAVFDKALSAAQVRGLYFSAGTPPVIAAQPLPSVAIVGSNVSLTVSAIGTQSLTYQWYKGTPGSGTPVSGGNSSGTTSPTLTFTGAGTGNAGTYYVVVTDPNALATTSAAANLNVITTPLPGNYFPSLVALNPVGYWPLNETVQPAPSSVATNYGTLGSFGTAGYSASGIAYQQPGALTDGDTSITGDGNTDEVVLPYQSALATVPLTMEGWFNPNAGFNGGEVLMSNGEANSPRTGLWVYGGVNGNDFNLHTYKNSGTSTGVNIDVTDINPGQWYYVAATVTVNPASNSVDTGYIITFYINGTNAGSGIAAFAPNADAPFKIGNRSDEVGYNFAGGMDDVAFYPSALSAATILAHYQAGTNPAPVTAYKALVLASHPLLYYRLDEPPYSAPPITSDPVANNYGGLGANDDGYYLPGSFPGTVAGPRVAGFPANVACRFSSPFGGYVQVPEDANNALDLHGPMTVTAWIQGTPGDASFQSFRAGAIALTGRLWTAVIPARSIGPSLSGNPLAVACRTARGIS